MELATIGAVIIFIVAIILFFVFLYYFPIATWIRTLAAGVPLGIITLVRMRLIGIPPSVIVANYVRARQSRLESHRRSDAVALSRRRQRRERDARDDRRTARADSAGVAARGGDRSGRTQRRSKRCRPRSLRKVIETPTFQGVAQNGIQLNVKARITVRSNLDRYVGGAGEPTIIARVGEGVVSAVGAAIDHKEVLEYPDRISKTVLAKGLDAGTAFEIVSIDIADVDVGKNIGAELQTSPSRGRSPDRSGQGRRAAVCCASGRAGAEGRDASHARQGRRSRSRDPAGYRGGVSQRQPRRDGLL